MRGLRWRQPRHRRTPQDAARPAATLGMVDVRTGTTHRVTLDAVEEGRLAKGRYVAVCGSDVLPASLTEPGRGYCRSCTSVPGQTARTSR